LEAVVDLVAVVVVHVFKVLVEVVVAARDSKVVVDLVVVDFRVETTVTD
jgi:hypothetical protein